MPGKRQPAAVRRKKAKAAKQRKAAAAADAARACLRLSPDVLANIHGRLRFLDRVAFAAVFGASCGDAMGQDAPWLVLPGEDGPWTATLFSLADRRGVTVRAPDPAMRDHVVLGSNRGWLATADDRGRIHLVNPATGVQHALPDITTMGVFLPPSTNYHWFSVVMRSFLEIRLGGPPPFNGPHRWGPEGYRTITFVAWQMRQYFYRKVVLSSSPRPRSYAAMLILTRVFGAPAFATAEHAAWRLAPSRDGVEDAIYHSGQFYSITYSGVVEAWDQHDKADGAKFTSTAVAPRLQVADEVGDYSWCRRKYLVAAPGARLMVVIKDSKETKVQYGETKWSCSFKVHVLDDGGEQWKETRDIGEAALFVGANNSLCVSTREHPELRAGSVYFTDDEHGQAAQRRHDPYNKYRDDSGNRAVGVYRLKDGTLEKMEALGQRCLGDPPAWITPSIP